jgi:hypothetical protein
MATETAAMPQGTPSAPLLRFSSPSASIPSLEQPLSGEIRGDQPTFGVIREEQGGKDLQQKKRRKMVRLLSHLRKFHLVFSRFSNPLSTSSGLQGNKRL